MSPVLRVTEYKPIRCAERFSATDKTVTRVQFEQLQRFNENFEKVRRVKVFQFGARNTLITQNFVGVIQLGTFQVEILPKIDADDFQVRRNLMQMVAQTLGLRLHGGLLGQLDKTDTTVLEVLLRMYCDLMWDALHKGVIRQYNSQRDNLTVLRGRINVSQQLRHNAARPDRLHCTFDEFTQDNELNRVLKLSLRKLSKLTKSAAIERGLTELLFCFDEVEDVDAESVKWERVKVDRLSERFGPLVRMAKMFIEGYSPDLSAGNSDGFAVLFDMNELFEEYVGRQLQLLTAKKGVRALLQQPVLNLARRENGSRCFQMKPDIVVMKNDYASTVLDTKWKRLNPGVLQEAVSSGDIYQMYAYSQRYKVKNVVLLYPHYFDLGGWRPIRSRYFFEVDGDGSAGVLSVATVKLDDLKTVPGQLEAILNQTEGMVCI